MLHGSPSVIVWRWCRRFSHVRRLRARRVRRVRYRFRPLVRFASRDLLARLAPCRAVPRGSLVAVHRCGSRSYPLRRLSTPSIRSPTLVHSTFSAGSLGFGGGHGSSRCRVGGLCARCARAVLRLIAWVTTDLGVVRRFLGFMGSLGIAGWSLAIVDPRVRPCDRLVIVCFSAVGRPSTASLPRVLEVSELVWRRS